MASKNKVCACCDNDCTCANCTGTTPCSFIVTLSGMGVADGAYEVAFEGDVLGTCFWRYRNPTAPSCEVKHIALTVAANDELQVLVEQQATGTGVIFRKDYSPSEPPCGTLVAENIPHISTNIACPIDAGRTCTVDSN